MFSIVLFLTAFAFLLCFPIVLSIKDTLEKTLAIIGFVGTIALCIYTGIIWIGR